MVRLRPPAAQGNTGYFDSFRQLLETLRVACFPVGVRSRQAAQYKSVTTVGIA
ncbi:hypothetical protein [Nostoc sp.]|uniref:hypothetical protein n=1 Tax=Nostoc sp. TaxID=1180 RepID=UPI002FFC55A3